MQTFCLKQLLEPRAFRLGTPPKKEQLLWVGRLVWQNRTKKLSNFQIHRIASLCHTSLPILLEKQCDRYNHTMKIRGCTDQRKVRVHRDVLALQNGSLHRVPSAFKQCKLMSSYVFRVIQEATSYSTELCS